MVSAFKDLVSDPNIIKEFDLANPESILNETIDSIDKTVEKKLESASAPPRRYHK